MRFIPRLAILSLAVLGCHAAWADDEIWTRSTLLDSPDGPKRELAAKGIDLGLDLTQFVQGLQNSGDGWPYGGKVDLRFRLDGQKLGTWAGFFVTGHVEYNYGSNANGDAQGLNIFPVNTALGYPSLNDEHVLAAVHAGLQPDDRADSRACSTCSMPHRAGRSSAAAASTPSGTWPLPHRSPTSRRPTSTACR